MMVFHRPPFDKLRASGERLFAQCFPTRAVLSENEHNIDVFSALRWETQVSSTSVKKRETEFQRLITPISRARKKSLPELILFSIVYEKRPQN
ncbi:MAG: hypothetical protein AB9891_19380 [Anaerolineaceae bacterium]